MTDLYFEGSQSFRQRIVLSTVTRKNILINNIRVKSTNPGLLAHEISFLRLINSITDGTKLTVDPTGTKISYKPGILIGVRPESPPLFYKCPNTRSVTYYLESLCLLAPFCKFPLNLKLEGITHSFDDISVDSFRNATIPILKQLGLDERLKLDILSRGSGPLGGGIVHFFCPPIKSIKPINWLYSSRIKRIRGIAYTNSVSNNFAIKLIDVVRGIFNNLLSDVWIYNDKCEGKRAGLSPGLGISILAETFDGKIKSVDASLDNEFKFFFNPPDTNKSTLGPDIDGKVEDLKTTPNFNDTKITTQIEKLGKTISWKLLSEIHSKGVVGTNHQYIPLFFMAIAGEYEPCQIHLSTITEHTLQFIKHLRDFFGTVFEIKKPEDENFIIIKCIGAGVKNLSLKAS